MCFDPVSLSLMVASTAATAAGNRMNQVAKEKALEGAVSAEGIRQKAIQGQADQNLNSTLSNFTPASEQANMDKALTDRTNTITGNLASNPETQYDAAGANQPQVVKSALAKTLSDAVARGKTQAQQLAAVGAPAAVMGNNDIAVNQAGSKAGMLGSFAQNSERVNQMERSAAMNKTSGMGDFLGLVGQGLNMYNAFSAPAREGSSLLGGAKAMPAGQFGPGQYSPFAKLTNNIPSIF